jgi:tetratricopeptide (TPR) repeat protein
VQAVDVGDNRVLWQETLNVPTLDLVNMRQQVNARVWQGLIPALGATADPALSGTRPTNEQAYDLFLRSVALAHDGEQNREAVRMLERSVGLDPAFAPAWSALGKRYYYEEEYGPASNGTMSRTEPTLRRALSLDPNLEDAEQQIVSLDADSGKLAQAYGEAKSMVERHPQSSFAHFTLSYVLRYASIVEEGEQECNTAMRLDPGNYQFRSCSGMFLSMGQYDRARDFLNLDAGSEWSNNVEIHILLRQGKIPEALDRLRQLSDSPFFHPKALAACYSNPRPAEAGQLLQQMEKDVSAFHDPEPKMSQSIVFNSCMGNAFTARLATSAIRTGFCGYDYLRTDVMLAKFRQSPEYPAVLAAAKQCRDNFVAARNQQ